MISIVRTRYVLLMWTGALEGSNGLPRLFSSPARARRALKRYPAWGHAAVTVHRCRVRPGKNGRPDYVIGEAV